MRKIIGLFLIALAVGCGVDPTSMAPPETIVVKGKAVQPSGQAIAGGRIRFSPAYGAQGAEAYAEIGPDGGFTLQSFGGKDGVMPGTYKVAVSGKATTGLAAKYQSPETSTLVVEITKDMKDLGVVRFQ